MRKSKVLLIFSIFLAIFILLGITKSNASSSDLYLNNLDFKAQINTDGSMDVLETWDIEIEDTNTLYKTFKIDKTRYSEISDVSVMETTNKQEKMFTESNEWKYHLTKDYYYGGLNRDGEFEICWGVGLDDRSATRKYQISYTVKDAIKKANDYSELYWQFVGEDFEISAKNITGEILLPRKAELKDEIKVWGHTEDLNGEIYATELNKIEFNINNFRSGRYVEIRTLFPTEMITYSGRTENTNILDSVTEEETVWANEANRRREMNKVKKFVMSIIVTIIAIAIDAFFIYDLTKVIKKIKENKKLVPTQSIEYYREVPREKEVTPAEALYLFRGTKANTTISTDLGKIFSATMLDLNLKKFIDFEVINPNEKNETVKIKLLKDDSSELDNVKDEQFIFEFLKDAMLDKKEITIKELESYIKKHPSKIESLSKHIKDSTIKRLHEKEFLSKENDKKLEGASTRLVLYMFFVIFAIPFISIPIAMFDSKVPILAYLSTIIVGIILIIASGIYSSRLSFGTQKAIDEQAQWKGLKKYMEDFSLLKERELPEIVLWEKFLVYATVFGIEKKVLKQLKMAYPDFANNTTINNNAYMYMMMNTNFSSSFSSAISSSISSTYSSATGGGGGFSGGGGRRPEVADGGGGR